MPAWCALPSEHAGGRGCHATPTQGPAGHGASGSQTRGRGLLPPGAQRHAHSQALARGPRKAIPSPRGGPPLAARGALCGQVCEAIYL